MMAFAMAHPYLTTVIVVVALLAIDSISTNFFTMRVKNVAIAKLKGGEK